MNNSTTDTVLDDDAVAEIEARAKAATLGPWAVWDSCSWRRIGTIEPFMDGNVICPITQNDGHPDLLAKREDLEFVAHARADIPALCATVRALRASMKTQKVELLQLSGRGELLTKVHVNFDDLDPLEAVRNEFDRLRNVVIRDLQSQLEQVTKELNEEKRLRAELKQIAQIGIAEVSSVGTVLKDNAIIDFRSRAIALCRDKAAQWEQKAKVMAISDENHSTPAIKARAAHELASELEQLK